MGFNRLPRRRDVLTLRRERFDSDARAPDRPATDGGDDPGCVAFLGVGDTDKLIRAGDGKLDPDFDRARKISHHINKLFDKGPGEFIAAEMRPGPVLDADKCGCG